MRNYEIPRVTAVRYVRDHIVWLRFSDGLEGEISLADGLRGEIFEPLLDPATFAFVRIDGGALAWPNGADWAPETLHEQLLAANGMESPRNGDGEDEHRAYLAGMPVSTASAEAGARVERTARD